ncbi:hypothetical protein ABBQ38_010955 [Trebouxia sp. C0009 RCD-2024]
MQDLGLLLLLWRSLDAKLSLSAKQAASANAVVPGTSTGYGPTCGQRGKEAMAVVAKGACCHLSSEPFFRRKKVAAGSWKRR